MRLLVNAANVTGAGPQVLATSLLPALAETRAGHDLTVVYPEGTSLVDALPPDVATLPRRVPRAGWRTDLLRLWENTIALAAVARRHRADVMLSMGDVGPLAAPCPHVVLLHRAQLAFSREELALAGRRGLKDLYLDRHAAIQLRRAAVIVVQSPVIGSRVLQRYSLPADRVVAIAQPTPLHVVRGNLEPPPRMAASASRARLLFLAADYPHKNHRILPAVAAELQQRGMGSADICIFVTLGERSRTWQQLRADSAARHGMFTNLGPLPTSAVRGALASATALFVPTLLESYGLTYVEALYCGTPVLTSDRDFARWMCRDLATYFEPTDPRSVASAIEHLVASAPDSTFFARARARLQELPASWGEVARQFWSVCESAHGPPRPMGTGADTIKEFQQ